MRLWFVLEPYDCSALFAVVSGECLKMNTTLTSLCIGDAAFGDESAAALLDGLRFNSGALLNAPHSLATI